MDPVSFRGAWAAGEARWVKGDLHIPKGDALHRGPGALQRPLEIHGQRKLSHLDEGGASSVSSARSLASRSTTEGSGKSVRLLSLETDKVSA